MNILGVSCSFWHDPAAALIKDGQLVAAIEQERLSRSKHAINELPVAAAEECLRLGGVQLEDLDAIAYAWDSGELERTSWSHWRRLLLRSPLRALKVKTKEQALIQRRLGRVEQFREQLGVPASVPTMFVEHHLAHAASSTYFSGFDRCAVLTLDGTSDRVTAQFGEWDQGVYQLKSELLFPDSVGLFYSSVTDYLGFQVNDGEYRLMGMAAYGDATAYDCHELIRFHRGGLKVNRRSVVASGRRRYEKRAFGSELVERWGVPRTDEEACKPYVDIAASTQRHFEQLCLQLLDFHLGDELERTRSLCFAGGCALNVSLNRRLLEHKSIDRLFVPPAPGDPGTAVGAAAVACQRRGLVVDSTLSPYLGPGYDSEQVLEQLQNFDFNFSRIENPELLAAELIATGQPIAWFQGRMEWGPRALGNRSILGHPGREGSADEINRQIKFREAWRPFCPAILAEDAAEILGSEHPAPHMNYSFRMNEQWQSRLQEVVHRDGTVRPQIVESLAQPKLHALISEFKKLTGLPAVINTSLNRRGEPMVCSPLDALNMFSGCDLEHLFLGDYHVQK